MITDRIYTLYIKTHNSTGLKYLGKCENTDVYKYKGSGKYWSRHLNKHGNDVTTEVLLETTDKAEMIQMGIYYSTIYNVVEDNTWANLKIEEGDGGDTSKTPGYIEYMNSPRFIEVCNDTANRMKIDNPMFNPETVEKVFSGDIRQKISMALTGLKKSEEHKEKLRQASLSQSDEISKRIKLLFADEEFKNKFKKKLKNVCDNQLNMSFDEFLIWITTVNVFNAKGFPNSRVKRIIDKLGLTELYYGEYYENKNKEKAKLNYKYYKDCSEEEFKIWISMQNLYRIDGNINPRIYSVIKYRGLLDLYYKEYFEKIQLKKEHIKNKKDISGSNNVMYREDVKQKHLESVNTPEYKQKMSIIKTGCKQSEETKQKMKAIAIEKKFGFWNKGVPKSDECKANQSIAALNRPKIKCEHCDNSYTKQNLNKHTKACVKKKKI